MPLARAPLLRITLVVILVAAFLCYARSLHIATLHRGEAPSAAPAVISKPGLSLVLSRQQLTLDATVASQAAAAAIDARAAKHFGATHVTTAFDYTASLPEHWQGLALQLLDTVATTRSAVASIDEQTLELRGMTDDELGFARELTALHASLPANFSLTNEVVIATVEPSIATLCAKNFAAITTDRIVFRQSSTDLRLASIPVLERLAEFAYDCAAGTIVIQGHTDDRGSAAWNITLSQLRADVVAAELIALGVAPDRLLTEGWGAERPIADNGTVQGRERNRRIEFEWR